MTMLNDALLNVPVVVTARYWRIAALLAVASRCHAGAAVTAVNDSPVTVVNDELSALSLTMHVTDVPENAVT